jgi:hypothetical protein
MNQSLFKTFQCLSLKTTFVKELSREILTSKKNRLQLVEDSSTMNLFSKEHDIIAQSALDELI